MITDSFGNPACAVNDGGYRFVDAHNATDEKERYLVERRDNEIVVSESIREGYVIPYDPFDDEALFLKFAHLARTEERILAFADEYGFLGIAKPIALNGEYAMQGESLSGWQREITRLDEAEQIRMAIQTGDEDALAEKIDVRRVNKETVYCSLKNKALYAGTKIIDTDSALFQETNAGEYSGIAAYFLKEIVNRLPASHRSGVFVLTGDKKLKRELRPSSLLAALWMQFTAAIENDIHFRKCLQCGKWFGVPFMSERGKPRLYCSNACNVKAYRERKQKKGK